MAGDYHSLSAKTSKSSLFSLDSAHTHSAAALFEDGINLTAKSHAFAGAVLSPKHARELTPSQCLAIATALSEQSHHRKTAVPYTLWITEAWRVLGWAEPSAALFWEMATMYHTLFLAGRSFAANYQDGSHIPPILSCGSTSSMGSANNSLTDSTGRPTIDKKKLSASAKELPVWLVGTYLLLHCEDCAYRRSLSVENDQRFFGASSSTVSFTNNASAMGLNAKMNFSNLMQHASLSPRKHHDPIWENDGSHCSAYLLRHLRKFLVLIACSHNPDAVRACMHLAAIPSPPPPPIANRRKKRQQYSAEEIRRQHDEEHGNVGLGVRLSVDDLDRLNLIFQLPSGGGIDDPPVKIGELIWNSLFQSPVHPTASILLGDVEQELRRHLEFELVMNGVDQLEEEPSTEEDNTAKALARLKLSGGSEREDNSHERAKQPQNQYLKELTYTKLRGTTILLKPSPPEPSSGASLASGEPNFVGSLSSAGRLHDLTITECSDAHFYLLQPFEHATISRCTGCTIVVGAIAGLLHVVDCEKTKITSAARRILLCSSSDVQICMFSPSPPLIVGDNRNCQFAPYNTYYDGLREDLLATGLAAAVVTENQSPYHGATKNPDVEGAWPPLQCASNKWKQPIELAKLEVPHVPGSPAGGSPTSSGALASPGADDKAMGKAGSGGDATMHAPVLLPASEFHILFVPVEIDASRTRKTETEENDAPEGGPLDSQYCRLLADVLHLSPFRLPVEYERRVMMKAERMRNIQQAVQKNLTPEQQIRFEEELNQGFREWLVTSGNLRQVLDLVHLERRGGAS